MQFPGKYVAISPGIHHRTVLVEFDYGRRHHSQDLFFRRKVTPVHGEQMILRVKAGASYLAGYPLVGQGFSPKRLQLELRHVRLGVLLRMNPAGLHGQN
jgi:hypothetical protein